MRFEMSEPCLCGDPACPRCGNPWRCVLCGTLMGECEHFDGETGEVLPEFKAAYDAVEQAERDAEARFEELP